MKAISLLNKNLTDSLFNDMDFFMSPFERLERMEVKGNKIDIKKNENEYVIKVEVPGYRNEDLSVNIEDGHVVIEGKTEQKEEKNYETTYTEFKSSSSFSRSIKLGKTIDTEKIQAEVKDGILKINLPFLESQKPKKIQIN